MSAQTPALSRTLTVVRQWHLYDAQHQSVGRMAQRIARLLTGRHYPTWNPNRDDGDNVTVVNVDKIEFLGPASGAAEKRKRYRYHTGFPGGLREIPASEMRKKHPLHLLRHAVAGMLPSNKFKVPRLKRLRLFVGEEHKHGAQFSIDGLKMTADLKRAAYEKLDSSLAHPARLPRIEEHLIGTQILPNDPVIREAWLQQREREDAAQAEWEASGDPIEEAKDTQGSRQARLRGANKPFIPSSYLDTDLGQLPKTSVVLQRLARQKAATEAAAAAGKPEERSKLWQRTKAAAAAAGSKAATPPQGKK